MLQKSVSRLDSCKTIFSLWLRMVCVTGPDTITASEDYLGVRKEGNPPCNAKDNLRAGHLVIEDWFRGYWGSLGLRVLGCLVYVTWAGLMGREDTSTTKKDTSVTFWAERIFFLSYLWHFYDDAVFCHNYCQKCHKYDRKKSRLAQNVTDVSFFVVHVMTCW